MSVTTYGLTAYPGRERAVRGSRCGDATPASEVWRLELSRAFDADAPPSDGKARPAGAKMRKGAPWRSSGWACGFAASLSAKEAGEPVLRSDQSRDCV